MRTILLFLTLLFFEKNAVAVVRPAVGEPVQLVENQTVKLSRLISKTHDLNLLGSQTRLLFFKKKKATDPTSPANHANVAAGWSLVLGVAAFGFFIAAIVLFSANFAVAWAIFGVFAVILGWVALHKSTSKRLFAFIGIFLPLIPPALAVLVEAALSDGD